MDQIGRYQLQAELGRGGFGRVYKAFDPTVGRTVAIKVLVSSGDADILTRFRNEAAATGKLRHRNIITIFDFGEQDGMPYLVMEYLEGQDLQNVAATGRNLTLLEKLSIMSQVADGLHHAHMNQIVHRDVKPANIMLLNDGTVKIMDFGIARLMSSRSTRLTQHGNLIGTISYIAPEQFMGNDVNELSDIFAYGTIFYELLTGQHPFKASDAPAIIYKITSVEPPPISSIVPECPAGLEQIISRLLNKKPEFRYQTLEDLQFDAAPIRLQLERQLSESLVYNARQAFEAGDMDAAQRITREALEHDANNSQARELREKIKRDAQIRVIRARSHNSILAAKEDIAAGLLSRAVQTLEAAVRLDPENSEVISLLNEANSELERASRAAGLLAQARRELEAQNLTNAYRNVVECLQNTPGSEEANELLGTIRKELDRRERDRRFEEALAKVESLAASESHEEALALLGDLEADNPGSQRVKELLASVHYAKQEKDRQRQLLADLNAAKGLIAKSHWNAAVDQLQRLNRQWPSQQEAKQLLAYALEQQTAQRQAEEVERIVNESGNLAARHEFEQALNLIEGGLRAWPAAEALTGVLEQTKQARQAYERECAIQEEVRRIREHVERKRFTEALREVEAAARNFQAHEIYQLKEEVEREHQRHEREQTIATTKQNARQWLESGNFLDAVESLREAVNRYPEDAEFPDLLNAAEAKLDERLRADAIDAVVQNANAQLQRAEFDAALSGLAEGLRRFPNEAKLHDLQREAEAAKLDFHRTRIETHWKEQRWNEALQAVESSLREYKNEPTLLALEKSIKDDWERRQRAAAMEGAIKEAHRLSSTGETDAAIAVLEQAVRSYPEEDALAHLLVEKKEQRAAAQRKLGIESIIREAGGLLDAQKFGKAIDILQKGLLKFPSAPELSEWLARARKADAEETHRRALQKVVDAASTLLEKKQYDAAIATLERHLQTYPGAPKLLDLLNHATEARAEEVQRAALARLIADAGAFMEKSDFDAAITALHRGMVAHPQERQLSALLEQATQGKAEAERKRAVQVALDRAAKLEAAEPYKALQALEQALQKIPGEPSLTTAKDALQARLEKRSAFDKLLSQARQLKDKQAWDEALRALTDAEKINGEAPEIAPLRAQIETAKTEAAVTKLAAGISTSRSKGKAGEALSQAEEALKLYPDSPKLLDLRKQILANLEADKRREAAAAIATEAQKLLDNGQLKEALELLEPAFQEYPDASGLSTLIAYVNETKAARERADEISRITREARKLGNASKWTEALALLQPALQRFPNEAGIRSLLEKIRREQALAQAETHRAEGRYAEALKLLDEHLKKHGEDATVRTARQTIAAEQQGRDSQESLVQASRLLEQGQTDAATKLLREAVRRDAGHAGLAALLAGTEQSVAATRQREDTIKQAEAALAKSQFGEALGIVTAALAIHPDEDRLLKLKGRIEAQQREDAIKQALPRAEAALSKSQFAEALGIVTAALAIHPDEDRLLKLKGRIESQQREDAIKQALSRAEAALAKNQFAEALELVSSALNAHPGEDKLIQLMGRIEASQREFSIQQAISRVESVLAKNQFAEALETVAKALAIHPDEDRIVKLKGRIEASQREFSIQQAIGRVESALTKNQFAEALETVAKALAIHPGEDRIVKLKGRIEAGQREFSIQQAIGRVDAALTKNQFTEALEAVTAALAVHPGEDRLIKLKGRIEASQREFVLQQSIVKAEAALTRKAFPEALEIVTTALAAYPGEDRLIKLKRRIEAQEAAEQNDGAIQDAMARAEAALTAKQIPEALQIINTALAAYPQEERLLKLKGRIEAQQRKTDIAALKQIAEEVKRAADVAALDLLWAKSSAVVNGYAGDSEFKIAQSKVQSEIKVRTAALSAKTKPAPVPVPDKPVMAPAPGTPVQPSASPMPKYVGIAAGVAALVIGGYYFLSGNKKPEVTEGTAQKTEQKQQPPPDTTARDAERAKAEALARTPAKLNISTNLEAGTVILDGKRVGQLQSGAFRLNSITRGKHSLKLSGPNGAEASFQFESQPGEVPKVVGPVSARQLEVLVVTNLNTKAEFVSSEAGKPITVAGQTVPAAGLDSLNAGAHEVKVGTAADAPVYLMNTAPSPALTVFLHANRDTGTLVVETRQDGAAVFIDNKRYSQTTVQGVVSIPLPSRRYTVRVEKPGFDAPPSQQVEIAKSQINRTSFTLVPQRGTLQISGVAPGTIVKLDGSPLGLVQGNGVFPVTPGDHTIELARDRFVTKQVRVSVAPGARVALDRSQVELTAVVTAPPPTPPVEVPKQAPPPSTPTDARDWEPLKDSRDVTALEAFRRNHPNSPFSEQAGRRLEDIRQQAAETARRLKEQADAAAKLRDAETAKAADAAKKNQDAQGVRSAIDRYARAFESKDLDALKAVWPGISGQTQTTLRNTFRQAKSISLKLRPESVDVNGNSATVVCARELHQMSDRPLDRLDTVTIRLKRGDNGWTIDSIQ